MKLYAQHGHAPSSKMQRAVEAGFIEGAILSARYLKPSAVSQLITDLLSLNPDIDILVDPEFYATRYVGTPNSQLRYLEEWPHFLPRYRNELIVGTDGIDATLRSAYGVQTDLGCTALIAPSIYISRSFDSIEAAIALSFINRAQVVADDMGLDIPVYATIAAGRDAIVEQQNYLTFLNAITAIEPSPQGVYTLIGAGPTDERVGTVRSEIMVPEVIAGWMLLNYSLSLNGLNVVNGCADVLIPLLGVAGGYAGATGWWTGLQVFSMGRYVKGRSGGQLPRVKYLSKTLLNRITVNEREAFAEVIPSVMNGLSTDVLYEGREPDRTEEVLQTWQAIASLNEAIALQDTNEGLKTLRDWIAQAEKCYEELQSVGFSEHYEANMEYLGALRNSLSNFEELAEL